ncbi:MAG: hypothetical protein ABI723_22280 [Bacteroidia bacterium]
MNKKLLLIFVFALSFFNGYSQSATEWQSDLNSLKQTVHSKYSNLFYNITANNWDKAVDDFNNQIPKMDKTEVLVGFIKLVALFHIGHTQMNTFDLHHAGLSLQLHRYPYQLYWFSDGLYIKSADKKYEAAVGGKITMIGDVKTDVALEAIRPLVSYENEQGYKANSVFYLAIPEFLKTQNICKSTDEVTIKYLKEGKEESVVFKNDTLNSSANISFETTDVWADARKQNDTPLWMKESESFRYMEYLAASKTLYVRHSVTLNDGDKTIAAFFNNMVDYIDKNDVQKLILDVRMNGGGNNYLNKEIITSIIQSKKINQKGKFFCIIGRRTFSACQNLVNELEKYTEVTFVGEPTSENVNFYGDTKTETLPNSKLQVNLSWLWWQNFDARDKRKATSPELAVDISFNDYYNNVDPNLKAIFNYEKEKPLFETLINLINTNKKSEAYQYAVDYKNNPLHRYVAERLEADINQEGYNQIQKGKHETANGLFEINIKLFPESANAFDSYAESFMNMGKKDEAMKYYEMAIAKDKEGAVADNSKKQIEKIKSGGKN